MRKYIELNDLQNAKKLAMDNDQNEFANARLITYLTSLNKLELAQQLAKPFLLSNSHIAFQIIKGYKRDGKIFEAIQVAQHFPNNKYIQDSIKGINHKKVKECSIHFTEEICEIIKDINYSGVANLKDGYYNQQSKMDVLKTLILEGYSNDVKEYYPEEFDLIYNNAKIKNNQKNNIEDDKEDEER